MKRILFCIPSLFHGGAEYQLLELCRSLSAHHGYTIQILSFYSREAASYPGLYEEFQQSGIRVDCLFNSMQTGLPLLRACRKYIKEWEPDVVQAFLQANDYMLIAGIGMPHRLFFGVRSMLDLSTSRRFLYRILEGQVAGYVGNARRVISHFGDQFNCPQTKRHVIYNGIDDRRLANRRPRSAMRDELGIPEGVRVFITVANMHFPIKGHAVLLKAWKLHASNHPADVLLLPGAGALQGELQAASEAMGISEQVRFLGPRGDVPDLLAASDVYVSPSLVEGFSNSIIEALLCGLPVVATDVGGTAELLSNGPHGQLVIPGDSRALSSALGMPLKTIAPERREEIRQTVCLEHLGTDYLALYESVR